MKTIANIAEWLSTGIPAIIICIMTIIAAIGILLRLLKPEPDIIPVTKETMKKLQEITPPGMQKWQKVEILIKDEWYKKYGERNKN